jgi:hypothetical protein
MVFTLEQAMKAQTGSRGVVQFFLLPWRLIGMGGQRQARPLYPGNKNRYPLYGRRGGPQGRSGRVRKFSRLPEFGPQTLQLVRNRYTE